MPARAPRHLLERPVRFVKANRGLVALGAVAAIAAFTALPAASAALLPPAPVQVQSFVAQAYVHPEVARDDFGISTYSVVQWPVAVGTAITSEFGYRSCAGCSTDHLGIDFDPGAGTPAVSIADGVVTQATYEGVYGQHVIVQHVIDGVTVSTLYAHLQADSSPVMVGQTVKRGDLIGLVGDTGQSTGAHLHFGVLIGADYVDPYPWLLEHVNI